MLLHDSERLEQAETDRRANINLMGMPPRNAPMICGICVI